MDWRQRTPCPKCGSRARRHNCHPSGDKRRIAELENALRGVVRHWREFGGMMIYNNAVNRDDYGMDERIEAAAKLIEST